MSSKDWQSVTLGEVSSIQTGPFGSQLHASDYVDEGIPSIMPVNIGDNQVNEEGIARIKHEDAKKLSKYLVSKGDIVYSRRGDVEKRALIRDREVGWLCGTGCLRVRVDKSIIYPPFASYYLGHPMIRAWIVKHAHGATMPNLNTSILEQVPFSYPNYEEQKAIADSLSAFDNKIDLNNHISKNLEEVAQAIFNSWFICFDPFTDNEFDDSELGMIPKGWSIIYLKDVLNFERGIEPGSKNYYKENNDGTLPFYRVGEMLSKAENYVDVNLVKGKILGKNEVAVSFDGTVGRVVCGLFGAYSSGIRKISSKNEEYFPDPFIYFLFKMDIIQDIITQHADGTTILHASKSIEYMKIAYNAQIVQKYNCIVEPIYNQIIKIKDENEVLVSIRDALLPKLMSGEIRVPIEEVQ